MTLRSYLWGMRVSTVFALVGWGFVLNHIDPEKTGPIGQLLFYASTFLALSGIFILFLTWLRRKAIRDEEEVLAGMGMSFRQGALLSLLSVSLLFLQSMRMLTWWDGLLVVAGIFLIELYFLSHKK